MPITYMCDYFRQKEHINGQNPAKQACKNWRKNFQSLASNHILGAGSLFSCNGTTCTVPVLFASATLEQNNNAHWCSWVQPPAKTF